MDRLIPLASDFISKEDFTPIDASLDSGYYQVYFGVIM